MKAVARAQLTLAITGIVVGAVGTAVATGPLTNRLGNDVGYGSLELHLMSFNRLGGLLTLALAITALAGTLRRVPALVIASSVGFGAFAVQVILGFSEIRGGNVTGSNGATLSFCLMMAIGLGVLVWADAAEGALRRERRAASR